jgi:putative CocE/NonD family hydrolase
MYDGGVFALDSSVYWAAETAIDEYLYDYPGPFDWDIRPVRDVVTQAVGNPRPKWIDEWATLESAHQPSLPDIRPELACLHLCGMFDFVASSQADAWNLASASGRGDHYLVLDAVDHSWAPLTRAGRTRGAEGMRAFLDRYNQPIREFLDAVFERNTAALPRVRWRPYADAEWRTETTWPPAASTEATYWALVGPGRAPALKTQAPDSTTVVSWTHDPESPVPSKSIPFHHLTLPPDFVDLPGRSDVATFVAEPLTAPLTLVGQATAECTLRSSSESTHLFARLFDVDPGGSWFEIAFGRRAARGPWPRDVTVRLSPLGYEVARGHRLAVVMSSSLFPRFALDQGTDGNSWHEWSPRPAIQEVAIGGPGGLRLKVRVWCDEREG